MKKELLSALMVCMASYTGNKYIYHTPNCFSMQDREWPEERGGMFYISENTILGEETENSYDVTIAVFVADMIEHLKQDNKVFFIPIKLEEKKSKLLIQSLVDSENEDILEAIKEMTEILNPEAVIPQMIGILLDRYFALEH